MDALATERCLVRIVAHQDSPPGVGAGPLTRCPPICDVARILRRNLILSERSRLEIPGDVVAPDIRLPESLDLDARNALHDLLGRRPGDAELHLETLRVEQLGKRLGAVRVVQRVADGGARVF